VGTESEPASDQPLPGMPPRVQAETQAVSDKIREARLLAGMTQQQLADALGVTQTAVSYWESGKRDMGVGDLLAYAAALGVAAASLLPGESPAAAEAPPGGRLARVEVKGFRDLGIVRVSETTLAGEPMLHAECADGSSADFPPSSLHFITWLPEGTTEADLRKALPAPRGLFGAPDDYEGC
jgi:transcriptional regulator with XRE-family HTH domain